LHLVGYIKEFICNDARSCEHKIYVILIVFPRQKWLRERASILRYTYVACLATKWLIPITDTPCILPSYPLTFWCWFTVLCISCLLRNGQTTLHGRSDGFPFKSWTAGKVIRDQMLFRGRH